MFDTRSFSVRLRAEVLGYVTGMKQAATATRTVAAEAAAAAVTHKKATQDISRASMVGGAALLGLAAVAAKTSMDFDKAMSGVRAATHETAKNMDLLRKAAVEAGAATAFTAMDAADAEKELAKAGVATTDILSGGLAGALSLAAAGQLEVGESAEIAATAMIQFHLAGKDIPHVADLLAAGAGKAQGEVSDLAQALQYVGPVAHGMGVSLEQTVGTLALFASQGQIGERAGTGLRGVLLSLTSPGKQAAAEMEKLGINLYDTAGNFVGLDGAAQQLRNAFVDLTPAQRDAALGTIFGNQQVTAARVLYEGGAAAVDKWTRKVNDQGYAAETAGIQLDNLRGDIEKLTGSLQTDLIQSGSGANGALRGMTQGATGAVNAFGDLPTAVQGSVTVISAVGGTALLAAGAFGTMAPKVRETRTALDGMGRAGIAANRGLGVLGKLGGYGAIAVTASVAIGELQHQIDKLTGDTGPEVDKLTNSLVRFADSGKASGETAKLFGAGASDIGHQVSEISSNMGQFQSGLESWLSLVGGSKSELAGFKANMDALDESLTGLVNSGNGPAAAAQFSALSAQVRAGGGSVKDFKDLLPDYQAALLNASTAQDLAAGSASKAAGAATDLGDGLGAVTPQARDAALAIKSYTDALADNTAIDAFTANAQLAKSFHDLSKEMKDGGKVTNDEKINLGGFASDVKATAQSVYDHTLKTKGQTAAQKAADGVLATGREHLAALAEQAGKSSTKAHALADRLLEIKSPPPIDVTLNTAPAESALASLMRLINTGGNIPVGIAAPGGGKTPTLKPAGGGAISGPGTWTSDSIPALLSDGEYVVKSSAVARYGVNLFSALNAEKFAAGGQAGHPTAASTASAVARIVSHAGDSVADIKAATAAIDRLTKAYEDQRATVGMNAKEKRRYFAEQRIDAAKERLDTKRDTATKRADDKAAAKKKAAEDAADRKKQHDQAVADAADSVVRDAQAAIDAAKQVRDAYAKTVGDSITSFGSLTGAINLPGGPGEVTGAQVGATDVLSGGLIARAKAARVGQARSFIADLRQLRAAGLNANDLQEIIGMGPAGGAAYASALVGDIGSIMSLNASDSTLTSLAHGFGVDIAGSYYQAGVDSAQGYLNGLAGSSPAIAAAVARLADELVANLRTALDAHSPSMRMHREVGVTIPAGILSGMKAGAPVMNDYLNKMIATPSTPQFSSSRITGPTGSGDATFHLYDSDGVLMGTMRGVANDSVGQAADSAFYGRVG